MKKCYFCSGNVKKEQVDIARYWGKDLIALNDVPAFVFQQCGERYFEAKVSAKIDQRIRDALKKKTSIQSITVPIVQF